MKFQTRVLLLVSLLLAITVFITAAALTWTALRAIEDEARDDAMMIVRLLVHVVEFAEREQLELARLLDSLVDREDILAIQVINAHGQRLAASTVPGLPINMEVTEADLRAVLDQGGTASYLDGAIFKVIAPFDEAQAGTRHAVIMHLRVEHVLEVIRRQVLLVAAVTVLVLATGFLASGFLARRVTEPVNRLTAAAAALEAGTFKPENLAGTTAGDDELARLARVFERMAREVYAREARLKKQLQELRIEIDETKKERQVREITESDYFKDLQGKVQKIRSRSKETSYT